jgi:predicted lipoprotein with Yx(FWY)xxD motif
VSRPVATALAALILTVTACGSEAPPAADATPTTPESSPESASPPAPSPSVGQPTVNGRVIITAGSDFGTMLFDESRQAIYLFDRETTSTPDCYGACAEAWPTVLTKNPPRARGDVRPGLLGTTPRGDGSLQVTYAGHPLYFYAHEGKNQVLCHNVSEFGGVWLVVTPGGDPAE